jgi:hypothetical protein
MRPEEFGAFFWVTVFPGSSQILWVNRRDANLRKDQPRDFIARFSVAQ